MASVGEKSEFASWHRSLMANELTPKQLAVLQQMVEDGEADNLEEAARLLDWQAAFIDQVEHLYGF